MYLGNPLLPIKLTPTEVRDKVIKELNKKNWSAFEINKIELNLLPYFLFNYHYYIKQDNTKGTIKSSIHGILAIDGHSIKVRNDLVHLLKHNWKKSNQEIPRGEFIEKYCNIDKKDQNDILKIKTAEYFNIPKEQMVISNPRRLLVPFYKIKISIESNNYSLIINAVNETIEGLKEIPSRQKGYVELTKETITELKEPKNWIKYSTDVIEEAFFAIKKPLKKRGKKEKKERKMKTSFLEKKTFSVLESKKVLIIIIILAILLILISIFKIKL